ncbi:vacuolar protein sorting-associated protein 41 homolog [Physcomitrium patens]|uniref:Vacuolar protein sorting-associated protein 41 homolog n=1 Tax=Physcomitrium patens TaxID=3218 RepID=A0A2K1JD65_PHYPA|nr:vacuolar protein sorting-associated protein 41 homolog isoform X1 [Physcomitrium patens]PNR39470.1 hypothetical protein PHYPA_019748 [Physcomitrium patens]|eukprot:XP_024396785.1 vacuolar protein sorting-associated protein 41 homolog isoform X1 [Physcomitrella patens]
MAVSSKIEASLLPTRPSPVQDGGEGDDELGDDDSRDDDDEGEGEEEEPRLKYQRLGGSLPSLLSSDAAACLTVGERMIALGTHDGTVHLLDFQGNQIREFRVHTATVNEVSFDSDGEYVGSCSDDGTVVISSLYSDEREKFEYHRPVKAIALDPEYARKSSKQFALGGLAGQLLFLSKGWLGYREQILHSGEGTVHVIKWRTSLIAWTNDAGVKVYDTASHQRITFIERSPRANLSRPTLVWQDDTVLLIGWADCIKIAVVRTRGWDGLAGTLGPGTKYVEIRTTLQTDYYVSGLAPFGDQLVVLAYLPDKEDNEAEPLSTAFPSQGHAQRPEVRIVTRQNEELATDALSIHGYEHYKAKDYVLAHAPFIVSGGAAGQWAAGDESLYYIVSPKDVVLARPRDADDHVKWLLQHGYYEKALAAVEEGNAKAELLEEVGSRYLDHLLLERQYDKAAELCPKLLRGSASAWERWVFHFAHLRQLPSLAPYIPTSNPQLRDTVYELVLNSLVTNPAYHDHLLTTIKTWPSTIFSVPTIIAPVQLQISTGSKSLTLKEVLAELYVLEKQYAKALAIYVELQKPFVFEFIEQHNLLSSIHDKVVPLMELNGKRAVQMLINQSDSIDATEVVSQLQKEDVKDKLREYLHLYLHSLFEKDPTAAKEYHGLQVELYADYEPRLLLPFLRSSHYYSLDKAYEVCTKRGLTRERVFILGRMGNSREALGLIINELKDIQQAVSFVQSQADDELWEELITQSMHIPDMVGSLLEHTVGHIDPLHLVNRVPAGMSIPRLRDRLVKIIADYRTETSLRAGCNDILKADCVDLLVRYYDEARHAVRVGGSEYDMEKPDESDSNGGEIVKVSAASLSRTNKAGGKGGRMPTNYGGSGRCCICFDPVALQNVAVVAFFCTHAYHETCLNDTSGILPSDESEGLRRSGSNMNDSAYGLEYNSSPDPAPMRCILCTTAASAKGKVEVNGYGRTMSSFDRNGSTWGAVKVR